MAFGWPDLVVAVIVLWYAAFAVRRGFVAVLMALLGFVLAFVLAFMFYPGLASYLTDKFGWSPVWSKPVAFVALWVLIETTISLAARFLTSRMSYGELRSQVNRTLAVLPGAAQGLIFAALILTVIAVMPVQSSARQDIVKSPVGGRLVQFTLGLARPLESIFGPAARETLGFITVKPPQPGVESHESIKLNFSTDDSVPDPASEEGMLELVNHERTSRGLQPMQMDPALRELARAHARDMFKRGYFAHVTPDGKDPFDRMRDAGIVFGTAGENLALAPALDMAHDGLMNSPGHRANILNPDYTKVGIGVLDGGVYGKMFVQEFTD
jgi:uncharacterized protein YkwD/uncharacterized membrane protein required for colicin V production